MKAVLRLEMIGDDFFYAQRRGGVEFRQELRMMMRLGPNKSPSFVARVTGMYDDGRPRKVLIYGTRDYSEANSTGSRGIYSYYVLSDGIYEVNDRIAWSRVRQYYLKVADGVKREIEWKEALECLNATSASPS